MNKLEFLRTLPKRECLYIIFSRLTNLPYVECNCESFDDEAFIFLEEAQAMEQVKALSAEKQPVIAVKADQKSILKLFADLCMYGVTRLVVTSGADQFTVLMGEIVRRPNLSKLPPHQRPLENPELQLSMMYYLQEARKDGAADRKEELSELEDEMAVNLLRAKYLIPVKEVETDGKHLTQLMLIKTKNGEAVAPIFSDVMEYNRFKKEQELKAGVTDFEKLAGMELPNQVNGFVLNPGGAGLILNKEYMKKELQLNRGE